MKPAQTFDEYAKRHRALVEAEQWEDAHRLVWDRLTNERFDHLSDIDWLTGIIFRLCALVFALALCLLVLVVMVAIG